MKTLLCLLILLSLVSCSGTTESGNDVQTAASAEFAKEKGTLTDQHTSSKVFQSKEIDGIHYSFSVIEALEYLKIKGEVVAKEDVESLSTEQVVWMEIGLSNKNKDIWQSAKLLLSEEDAMNYLTGVVASDLTIEQGGKEFSASGVNYSGKIGAINTIKIQFFFKGLATNKPMKAVYYDCLFGAGIVKCGINERY